MSETDWTVRVDVISVLVISLEATRVLIFTVEKAKLVALIVDAVSVEPTFIELTTMAFPTTVIVLMVVIFIVEAVILDAIIRFAETVLPVIVE